jgi:DbpA RNA binding domain
LEEWGIPLSTLASTVVPAPLLAIGPGQVQRRFRDTVGAGVMVTSPTTAVDLRQRSLIEPGRIGAVIVGWPENWEDPEALTVLLQDVSRESQRIFLTADPATVAPLIERHAWRALTIGLAPALAPLGPVVTVEVPWARRVANIPALVERLGADSVAVWTVDQSHHAELNRILTGLGAPSSVTTRKPDPVSHVIAFDPPSPAMLGKLLDAGAVTVLVPPGTERWIERIANPRKPLVWSGTLDAIDAELARRRTVIERATREGPLDEGLLALGPVFDQFDPAAVAAALYQLWTRLPRPALAKQIEASTAAAPRTRLWVGAGKKDDLAVGDLVGILINELRMDRSAIGKIEMRDTFSLVEVPAPEAERIAQALSGRTLRRRRLVARVDRKP